MSAKKPVDGLAAIAGVGGSRQFDPERARRENPELHALDAASRDELIAELIVRRARDAAVERLIAAANAGHDATKFGKGIYFTPAKAERLRSALAAVHAQS